MRQQMIKFGVVLTTLLLIGCGEDNAYDGTNLIGGNPTATQSDAFSSLQTNVLQKEANSLLTALTAMRQQVTSYESNLTGTDMTTLQDGFKTIMQAWKGVEACYIAAEYESTLIDTPQLIDYFHTGKTLDVPADIDAALALSTDINDALFKNSSKSITALEYLLFGHYASIDEMVLLMNTHHQRRLLALGVVLENLEERVTTIADFYSSDTKFVSNVSDASNALVNVLIDSAYKLKEWRLGEAAGIVTKYADDPDPSRLEYANSHLSLEAIQAILVTHDAIMGEQTFTNFGSFAMQNGAQSVVTQIRTQITTALTLLAKFTTPLEENITTTSFDPKIEELYTIIKELQALYFESLIQALSLTAEIIEADGD